MIKNKTVLSGLSAFSLTALVLFAAFYKGGFFPFGWGSVSWCDMNQQLIPLFCDFKDILAGEKSLFLNFANAGGMNFYGVFCFFLCSPFTLAVAFVNKADIPFLMNILVLLKLSVAGFTAAFVLKRLYSDLKIPTAAALGTAYALCGYGMLFYQNIMWLDLQYLFPLTVLGAYTLIRQKKPLLLTVMLTLSVIFNFYISYTVFIFVILFFGVFALFNPKADRIIYLKLCFAGVFSLLCSAFVWVPSLLQYISSARSGGFLANIINSEFFAPYDTTLTILLCSGIIFAALVLMLAFKGGVQQNQKPLLCVFLLTCVPLIAEPVNLMWHTGSYMSFPARYGFITVFTGLLLTAGYLEKSSVSAKCFGLKAVLITATALGLGVYALIFTLKNADTLSAYVKTLWGNREALKGQLLVCFIFAVGLAIIIFALKKGVIRQGLAGVLLCLVVALEGFGSADVFILSAKNSISLYTYQSVISLKDSADIKGFYRVNTCGRITEANMTGAAGFNSLGHYTSLNDETYMETARLFGYSGYWMETENWDGSLLSDALLSVGYTADENNGSYTLEKNPYYLGLGIKAEGNIPTLLPEGDRLAALGTAFAEMTQTENPVIKYDPVKTTLCNITESKKGYYVSGHSGEGSLSYHLTIGERETLYFDAYNGFSTSLIEPVNGSFSVYVNGQLIAADYPAQKQNGLLNLGSFEAESVDITIITLRDCELESFGLFGIKEEALGEYVKTASTLELYEKGGKIIGSAKAGKYFVSLPYKDNYKITLNGEKLSYSKALNGFIAIDIAGEGTLEISFVPKGFYIAAVISVLAVLGLVLLYKRLDRFSEKTQNIIYGCFAGGFGATLLWVYIIPMIIKLSGFEM